MPESRNRSENYPTKAWLANKDSDPKSLTLESLPLAPHYNSSPDQRAGLACEGGEARAGSHQYQNALGLLLLFLESE